MSDNDAPDPFAAFEADRTDGQEGSFLFVGAFDNTSRNLSLDLRLREDQVTESDAREQYQQVAPATEQGLYLVPRVIE